MRNFKKIVLMVAVLLGMELLAEFLLVPVTYQRSLDRELEALEKQGTSPNVVILGDSTVVYGLAPLRMEEAMGTDVCVVNAGTSSQTVWGSYYYLKDLRREYPEIKYVVLGVDYWAYADIEKSIKKELLVLDRVKNPFIKGEYVLEIFRPEEYPYLLKSYAFRNGIANIGENVKEKLLPQKTQFVTRGHRSIGPGMGEERVGMQQIGQFDMESINPRAVQYLDRIYEFCKKENIKLYLVSMPLTSTAVYESASYEAFWQYFREYADRKQVTFWDMNILKDRYEVIPDGMMADIGHAGDPGYVNISRKLGELLKTDMEGESVEEEFYPSVQAWENSQTGIIGCDFYTEAVDGTKNRRIQAESLQSEGVIPEYEFWISVGGEDNWVKMQEYGKGDSCVIPGYYFEKDVWMKICCRKKGSAVLYEKSCVKMREAAMGNE
ncbi:MAG: hypothetical protein Q4C58_07045 [Eubacteriales bacterium]|nr:hypothetical protein [Eubacteriales bacterium]